MVDIQTGVTPIFPTYLWKCQLPEQNWKHINSQLVGFVERCLGTTVVAPMQKLQTENNLHTAPEMAPLVDAINSTVRASLDFLKVEYNSFSITGCWANVSGSGSSHKPHAHPNNFFSGVYYAEAPEGGNKITFHDPRPQMSLMKPPVKEITQINTDHLIAAVAPGTIVLFPSWLEHSVPVNESNQRRMSVAFNVMFDQFAETMSAPMWKPNPRK